MPMAYYQPPPETLEDPRELRPWFELAMGAALRKSAVKEAKEEEKRARQEARATAAAAKAAAKPVAKSSTKSSARAQPSPTLAKRKRPARNK